MIIHFPFVSTKGLAIPLLLSAFSASIWQMPNIYQSKHWADSICWISQMLKFNKELFGLMSLPYYVSLHIIIESLPSSGRNQYKPENKTKENKLWLPPHRMFITPMSCDKISYAGSKFTESPAGFAKTILILQTNFIRDANKFYIHVVLYPIHFKGLLGPLPNQVFTKTI